VKFNTKCAGCFAGLSCQTRIRIINLLKNKQKLGVLEIKRHFNLSQPTITHHLKYLKKAGVLNSFKKGRKVYYSIDPKCGLGVCELF